MEVTTMHMEEPMRTRLKLKRVTVPEWEAEDEIAGVLAGETVKKANDQEARKMLDQIELNLPLDIKWCDLQERARASGKKLLLDNPSDAVYFDFYEIKVPLNILLPGKERIVRLRLNLDLETDGKRRGDVVAYNLYPSDKFDLKTIMSGEAYVDIAKSLKYVLGPIAELVTNCIGLKLSVPFDWKSSQTTIQTSDEMSNHIYWYITDVSIQNGFTGSAIIRAPKGAGVKVNANLSVQVVKTLPLGIKLKSDYQSESRIFTVGGRGPV